MTFGARLVALRKSLKMSQATLAATSGVSQSAISMIEKGLRSPSEDTMRLLAKALNVSTTFLMDEQEQAPPATEEELDNAIVGMLGDLTPEEVQRVQDFIAGMKAARKE